MVVCSVLFLDESEIKLTVNDHAYGQSFFDEVCSYFNLAEKDYFGLKSECSIYKNVWVKSGKRLKHQFSQKKEDVWTFKFLVKFYPSDPSFVKEELTKYHLCLQMREDLLTKRLPCPLDTLAVLSSYWLQSEFGDNEADAKDLKQSLSSLRSILDERSISDFEPQVLKLYRSRRGMPAVDADTQFLRLACRLPLYGVHRYTAADKRGGACTVGVSSSGIVEITSKHDAVTYKWNRIKHINFKKKKFYLKILGTSTESHSISKSFTFDSAVQSKALWQNAVDHHVFYRTTASDKTSTASIQGTPVVDQRNKLGKKRKLSFRLSFRKKRTKTEAETREESSQLRRQNPTVVRHSSLRRSASLKSETSSSPSTSEASPIQKNELRSILKQAKRESSSEDEDDGRPYTSDDLIIDETTKVEVVKSNLLLVETIPEEDEESVEIDESTTSPKKTVEHLNQPVEPTVVKNVPVIVHETSPKGKDVIAVHPPEVVIESLNDNQESETPTNPISSLSTKTNALGPPPLLQQHTKDALKIKLHTEMYDVNNEITTDTRESPRTDSFKPVPNDDQPKNVPDDIPVFPVQSINTPENMDRSLVANTLDGKPDSQTQSNTSEASSICSNQSPEQKLFEEKQSWDTGSNTVEVSPSCNELPRAESLEANQGSEPEENVGDELLSSLNVKTPNSSTEPDPPQPIIRENTPIEKITVQLKDEEDADDWKTIGASSAVAVLGDDDTNLNDVVGYEEDVISYGEENSKDEDLSQVESYSSKSPASSISELTNNTDELCNPNILDIIWAKCLGPENSMNNVYHELFGVKLRPTKGRLYKRDAKSDAFGTVEYRSIGVQVPCLPEEDTSKSTRRCIPSWPFDPDSLASKSKIDELDQAAITAALQAHVECNEIRQKIESNINTKPATAEERCDSEDSNLPTHNDNLEFPLFAKSVALYYLHSSTEPSSRRLSGASAEETLSEASSPIPLETPKFPPPIKRFVSASDTEEKDEREYNIENDGKSPLQDDSRPQDKTEEKLVSSVNIVTNQIAHAPPPEDVNTITSEQESSLSSGRSTPLPSSAGSTLSRSSFPRFIHSVFPLRKSSASSESGRSKERGRKKQKKRKSNKSKKSADIPILNPNAADSIEEQRDFTPGTNETRIPPENMPADKTEHKDERPAEYYQVNDDRGSQASETDETSAVKDDTNTSTTGSIDEIVLSDADEVHTHKIVSIEC